MTEKLSKYMEGVGWRYETEHSMTRRMVDHDYQSRCIYMLTLTLADRTVERLGSLAWEDDESNSRAVANKTPENAKLVPTSLGCLVKDEWYRLEAEHPQTHIIRVQLMPEHLHVVLYVKERIELPLGKYVAMVKSRCNKHFWKELTIQGLLGPKGIQKPPTLFSENFTDSILMHEGQLENMITYVEQNPYRALVKRENRELFRQIRQLVVYEARQPSCLEQNGAKELSGVEQGKARQPSCLEQNGAKELSGVEQNGAKEPSGVEQGKARQPSCLEQNGAKEPSGVEQGKARQPSCLEQNPSGSKVLGTFAAIGNRWLLDRPMRMQVRCHNNGQPENLRLIQRQKEYFLERGRKGGVVVSPCISPGEKEIARAALDAGVPLVVILENGFPPMYKPAGKYFEACAKGSLLMLAPWPYHMEKRTITRSQCLALNDMAYKLSTEPWTMELEERLRD